MELPGSAAYLGRLHNGPDTLHISKCSQEINKEAWLIEHREQFWWLIDEVTCQYFE